MTFDLFYMQIFCLGLLVLVAHFCSKITSRLKIGEVVGQVLGGLVVGPILLLFIENKFPVYRNALNSLHFFAFVFLSLIAFGIGDELNRTKLRSIGKGMLALSLIEGFITWTCVTVTFLLLGVKPIVALLIGSIGIATAPAATFAIMNRLDIGGTMRSMLGGMVVLDDVIEIIIFSITCQAALLLERGGSFSLAGLSLPVAQELLTAPSSICPTRPPTSQSPVTMMFTTPIFSMCPPPTIPKSPTKISSGRLMNRSRILYPCPSKLPVNE